jgi:hypothetical protein
MELWAFGPCGPTSSNRGSGLNHIISDRHLVKKSDRSPAEVGKVNLKSNGDEALSDEFLLKSNGNEALIDLFL